jgi:hypothetical protein
MPHPPSGSDGLEKKLESKLDQARVGSWRSTGDGSEICVIRSATGRVRGSELSAIEEIEKFHSSFNSCATFPAEDNPLKNGKIKIDHAIRTQGWIDARFVAEREVRGRNKTRRIKPSIESREAARCLLASWRDIWARTCSEQCRIIGLPVTEYERKSSLECGYTVDSPTVDHVVQRSADVGKIFLALSKGEIEYVADDQALWHILRR